MSSNLSTMITSPTVISPFVGLQPLNKSPYKSLLTEVIQCSKHHVQPNGQNQLAVVHHRLLIPIRFQFLQKNVPFPLVSRKRLGSKRVLLQSKCNPYSNIIITQNGIVHIPAATIGDNAFMKKLKDELSFTLPEEHKEPMTEGVNNDKSTASVTVVGASGNLAKKKCIARG